MYRSFSASNLSTPRDRSSTDRNLSTPRDRSSTDRGPGISRTDHGPGLSKQIDQLFPIMYDLDDVSRIVCMSYCSTCFPGLDLRYKADPTQSLTTAGEELDDLHHDLYDLYDLPEVCYFPYIHLLYTYMVETFSKLFFFVSRFPSFPSSCCVFFLIIISTIRASFGTGHGEARASKSSS